MAVEARNDFKPRPGRQLDGRTRFAKKRRALASALVAELELDPTGQQRLQVERAAGLLILSEDCMSRRLAGDTSISIDDCVRLSSEARRSLAALGITAPEEEPEQFPEVVMAPPVYGQMNADGTITYRDEEHEG